MFTVGVSMATVGVAMPQCVCHGLSRCGNASVCCMASVGVTMPQCVWHGLSGCGLASVGVA